MRASPPPLWAVAGAAASRAGASTLGTLVAPTALVAAAAFDALGDLEALGASDDLDADAGALPAFDAAAFVAEAFDAEAFDAEAFVAEAFDAEAFEVPVLAGLRGPAAFMMGASPHFGVVVTGEGIPVACALPSARTSRPLCEPSIPRHPGGARIPIRPVYQKPRNPKYAASVNPASNQAPPRTPGTALPGISL